MWKATSRGLSAHADYAEMIDWLKPSKLAPKGVFVTHGEGRIAHLGAVVVRTGDHTGRVPNDKFVVR